MQRIDVIKKSLIITFEDVFVLITMHQIYFR